MSGLTSRLLLASVFTASVFFALSASAQNTALPTGMTNNAAAASTATPTQLWRSDAVILEAEKMIMAGQYVDSLTLLEQAVARNMHNIEAHAHTALVWYHLGNNDKAKESIKSVQIIDRNHIGSYVILGMIALKEQKIDAASDYLGIIRMLCRGETCPEYQTLLRLIRETPPAERKPWYHF